MLRKAYIGDIHGSLEQLEKLYGMLQHYSLDAIEHCGDLIDRGPDPGGVLQFCRERKIDGVLGNHESVMLQYLPGGQYKNPPTNPDKRKSFDAILKDPANIDYLKSLPYYKTQGELLQVHAGVHPYLPLEQQQVMCCTASLVHPNESNKIIWMEVDRKGVPESVHREKGWFRWYEQYAWDMDVVVGHQAAKDAAAKARVHRTLTDRSIYFVDTGAWFWKNLTALIYPDLIFVSTALGEYKLTA